MELVFRMHLTPKQIKQLQALIVSTQALIDNANNAPPEVSADGTRTRRRGKDLMAFKKLILKERKAGKSVTDLAREHGVTPAYLYGMK